MRNPQRAHTLFKAKRRRPPQSAPHGARQRVATQPRSRTRGRGAKIRRAGLGAGRAPAASTRPAEGAACSATGLPLVREVFRHGAGSAPHPPFASHYSSPPPPDLLLPLHLPAGAQQPRRAGRGSPQAAGSRVTPPAGNPRYPAANRAAPARRPTSSPSLA